MKSIQTSKLEKVSPELGARITRIAHKYRSEGLTMDSIQYIYHKDFLSELKLHELGFDSIEDLIFAVLSNEYPIEVRPDSEGISRLYSDLKNYYYWLSGMKVTKQYDVLNIMAHLSQELIPCGQQLPSFEFPDYVEFNRLPEILSGNILNDLKYSEVKLMSAISPHEMYLQLCGTHFHDSYHKLRTQMRFYDKRENREKYRIPSILLIEDSLCAAKYPQICNEWHRSRIISYDKYNNVTLELVDIGEIITENVSELRLLLKRFAVLPPQAIRVRLTAIRPFGKSGQSWSQWSKNFVISLKEYNHCGRMECAFVDFQKDRFRVYLKYYDRFKSSNMNDLLFLHQVLVNKKLALISGKDDPIE